MSFKRILAWIIIPYVMIFIEWKKVNVFLKIYGSAAALFFFIFVSAGIYVGFNEPLTQQTTTVKSEVKKPKQKTAEELKKERQEKFDTCFNAWNGSHIRLTDYIKEVMNDPDSYDHDETTYRDFQSYLIVTTSFRGKNAFGGVVKNEISAKVTADNQCKIIEIIE